MNRLIGFLLMFMLVNAFADEVSFLSEAFHAQKGAPEQKTVSFEHNHHLIFFFASTCPHCHNFSPVLKKWVDENDFKVEAYSFDGQPLPEFREILIPGHQLLQASFQNEAIRYPALFVVNTETANLYPVTIGELNSQELEARMRVLISKIRAFERGVA
jgi:type-F conjugative transfer system pilin assembly thiol-disulfide isomerase TrbB